MTYIRLGWRGQLEATVKNMFRQLSCIAILAGVAGVAHARAVAPQEIEIRVGYADLDLARPGDARTFEQRVYKAAQMNCQGAAPIETPACAGRVQAALVAALPPQTRRAYAAALAEPVGPRS